MPRIDRGQPALTPTGGEALAERREREARALRENLRRRKNQQSARAGNLAEPGGGELDRRNTGGSDTA